MSFKNAKAEAKRRKITTAQRAAVQKVKILEGFQCPHKRCTHVLTVAEYRAAAEDAACPRCAAPAEDFVPVMVDARKVLPPKPEDFLKHDKGGER